MLLFCESLFKCNKLAVCFKLWFYTNKLDYSAYKTIDTDHTAITDCNTNYRIILLMMLFITSSFKPLKIDPSREK